MSAALVWTLVLLAGAASSESLGLEADIYDFPSLAQVEFHVSSTWVQHCAASVLTSFHVLSTASCFSGPDYAPQYRRIRAGSSTSGVGGQLAAVQYATTHPDYGLLGLDSDIAVVRLSGYLVLGGAVQQASILGQGIELPLGLRVTHVGWGSTAEGKESPDLYSLDLEVHDNEWCLIEYLLNSESKPDITENMVCVGLTYLSGKDFDRNDVGAPIFYENTLVGLLSYGENADDSLPIVATNVGSFTSWIIANAM